jgi:hypothetical protein
MKEKYILTILIFSCFNFAFSQTFPIEVKKGYDYAGILEIEENEVLTGYRITYEMGKDGKDKNQIINITDLQGKIIGSTEISSTKDRVLLDYKYNGTNYCFAYYEAGEKRATCDLYDKKLNKLSTVAFDGLDKRGMFGLAYQSEFNSAYWSPGSRNVLQPIKNSGFVFSYHDAEEGAKLIMEAFDVSGKKLWKFEADSKDGKKSFDETECLLVNSKMLVNLVTQRDKKNSLSNFYNYLSFIDLSTGKEVGRIDETVIKHTFRPRTVRYNELKNLYYVGGEIYNTKKDSCIGVCIYTISSEGKIVNEKESLWRTEISNAVSQADNTKLDKNTSVYVHEIIPNKEGGITIVGEQYRSAFNSKVLITSMLGNGSLTKIEVYNIVLLEYDNKMNLSKVEVFDNGKKNVSLPEGATGFTTFELGQYVESKHQFNFFKSHIYNDLNGFYCCFFSNLEKNTCEMVICENGKTSIKKVSLDNVSGWNAVTYQNDKIISRMIDKKKGIVELVELKLK